MYELHLLLWLFKGIPPFQRRASEARGREPSPRFSCRRQTDVQRWRSSISLTYSAFPPPTNLQSPFFGPPFDRSARLSLVSFASHHATTLLRLLSAQYHSLLKMQERSLVRVLYRFRVSSVAHLSHLQLLVRIIPPSSTRGSTLIRT